MLTPVVEPRYHWKFATPAALAPDLLDAGSRLGLSPLVTGVLAARGVAGRSELEAFFAPPLEGLHDPALLPDAGRAAERLQRARRAGERVQVFGDFDADGLTGLALLVLALRRLGVDAVPYVPDRLEDGHGLSAAAVEAAAAGSITVIVTVDTGSSSPREVEMARERGIDVIVTDHHRVPPSPPRAHALVNPQRPDAVYPDRRLSGSGVAFKLAQLLLAGEPDGPRWALELADLATIGTVADLAPVLGENRAIARLGLERLRSRPRPGIAALLAEAKVAPESVTLDTIAFALAPRLNAAGRVGEAIEAARLLLAEDPAEAAGQAAALGAANVTRRDLTRQAVAEARALPAAGLPAITIVRGPWPVGIVGLVAARLVEETGRPAVVGAQLDGVVRASCRSDGRLDLGAALESVSDLLIRHGGHAGAAGFEVASERWDALAARLLPLAASAAPDDPRQALRIDLCLPGRAVDYALLRDLARLEPTGPGHPQPLVCACGLTVTRVRPANGGHTQLTLRRELDVLDGIAFGRADLATLVAEGDRVDVVARAVSREFGGYESIQLEIRDVAPAGSQSVAAAMAGTLALLDRAAARAATPADRPAPAGGALATPGSAR